MLTPDKERQIVAQTVELIKITLDPNYARYVRAQHEALAAALRRTVEQRRSDGK